MAEPHLARSKPKSSPLACPRGEQVELVNARPAVLRPPSSLSSQPSCQDSNRSFSRFKTKQRNMVLLEVSAQTRALLLSLEPDDGKPGGPSKLPDVIDHSVIVSALNRRQSSSSKDASSSPPTLDSLLKGSKLHHAPPRTSSYVRPPELDARLAQIRRQNEEDEYRRMLSHDDGGSSAQSGSAGGSRPLFNESDDWRETSSHLSALLNILFSCIGVVCALWFCCAQIGTAVEVRVLLCMLGGTVVVAAEAWLYSRHFEREKRREERRRREGWGLMTGAGSGGMGMGRKKKEKEKEG